MVGRTSVRKTSSLAKARRQIDCQIAVLKAYLRVGRISRLDMISRVYLRVLLDVVRCDGGAIVLTNRNKADTLACKYYSPLFPSLEFDSAMPAILDMVAEKGTTSLGDVASGAAALRIDAIKSSICVPIKVQGNAMGMICVCSLKKNAFRVQDIRLTEFISQHLSRFFEHHSENSMVRNLAASGGLDECFSRQEFYIDIADDIRTAKTYKEDLSILKVNVEEVKQGGRGVRQAANSRLVEKTLHVLASNVRAHHKIYSYDKAQFIIVLGSTSKEKAMLVAKRLNSALEKELSRGDGKTKKGKGVAVSIGIAAYPADAGQIDKLIEAAGPSNPKTFTPEGNTAVGGVGASG